MAYKVYTSESSFVIQNTATGYTQKFPKGECWYSYDATASPIRYKIYFKNPERLLIFEQAGLEYTAFADVDGNGFVDDVEFQEYLDSKLDQQPVDYYHEVGAGKIPGKKLVNKFGYNLDVDSANEEIIASFGGTFDPLADIMQTAQTFTISYDDTEDGSTANGAKTLLITYLDENFIEQDAFHVLGSSGSDVTSFTGLGINRAVCVSFGTAAFNGADITITATTDATTQAQIPAEQNVTQQCIYHTQIGHNFFWDQFLFNSTRLAGGGTPEVTIVGHSFSRVTLGVYEVFRMDFDTQRGNDVTQTFKIPFPIGGREVIYFTAATDTNNTIVNFRFSGVEELA